VGIFTFVITLSFQQCIVIVAIVPSANLFFAPNPLLGTINSLEISTSS
jgi:hypothetical protein